ncbi:MAG: hypothetical protein ACRCX8_20095 [Sarcina sp.]
MIKLIETINFDIENDDEFVAEYIVRTFTSTNYCGIQVNNTRGFTLFTESYTKAIDINKLLVDVYHNLNNLENWSLEPNPKLLKAVREHFLNIIHIIEAIS